MTIATFSVVALDCPDTFGLARFYQQVVGGEIEEDSDADWVVLRMEKGANLAFQQVLDYEPPEWPEGAAQQAHLDFNVADLDATEAAVLAVGARKHDVQPQPNDWRVFLDPAGHPFCLCLHA